MAPAVVHATPWVHKYVMWVNTRGYFHQVPKSLSQRIHTQLPRVHSWQFPRVKYRCLPRVNTPMIGIPPSDKRNNVRKWVTHRWRKEDNLQDCIQQQMHIQKVKRRTNNRYHQPAPPIILYKSFTSLPQFHNPLSVTERALNIFTCNVWDNKSMGFMPAVLEIEHKYNAAVYIAHFWKLVVHPITGEMISKYKKLATGPATKEVWTTAFGEEFRNMVEGDNKTNTEGTNSILVLEPHEIKNIQQDRSVNYEWLFAD